MNVAIDQQSQYLYWTERAASGRIGRCNFDGTNIFTILNDSYIWALAIDFKNRFVFHRLR